jgi:hypothetical protein
MPVFEYDTPDGATVRVTARDEADADAQFGKMLPTIQQGRMKDGSRPEDMDLNPNAKPFKALPKATANLPPMPGQDPSEGMDFMQKFDAAAGGGMRNMYLGGKNLIGLGTPEDKAEREAWAKNSKHLGLAGTLGEAAGEAALTMPLGGPIAKGVTKAGQVLTKAIPKLTGAGSWGGRMFNVKNAANAVGQGAAAQGIVGDVNDKDIRDRGDDVLQGGGMGLTGFGGASALGGVVKGGYNALAKVGREVFPTAGNIKRRVYEALVRNQSAEGADGAARLADHLRTLREGGERQLSHTPASLTQDPGLMALEKGGHARGGPGWADKRSLQAHETLDAMNQAGNSEGMQAVRSKFIRNGIPQGKKTHGADLGADFQVPHVAGSQLRAAVAKAANGMSDPEMQAMRKLYPELDMIDNVASSASEARPDFGMTQKVVSGVLAAMSAVKGSPGLWKLRAAFNASVDKGKTTAAFDEVMQDPQKFYKLVSEMQAKLDAGRPLSHAEELLKETLLATGRQAAVQPPETENAP